MGKTHSKPLAARHGRGTVWARRVMCESALNAIANVLGPLPLLQPARFLASGVQCLHKTSVLSLAGTAATADRLFFRSCFAWTHAVSVHKDGIALEASAYSSVFRFCS
jgi:hypothetical protein